MILTEDQKQKLDVNVDRIRNYLSKGNINIPFFIAGGSVYSILNGTSYNDIDVYFYRSSDYSKLKRYIEEIEESEQSESNIISIPIVKTGNAITVDLDEDDKRETIPAVVLKGGLEEEIKLDKMPSGQFIHRDFGTPEKIFETYDYNCSQIAYTSEGELIVHKNFSTNIEVYLNEFKGNSLRRYIKYTRDKKATDFNFETLSNIYDYLFDNYNEMIQGSYDGAEVLCRDVLNNHINMGSDEISNYFHDYIIECFTPSERVDIFFELKNFTYHPIKNPCDELVLYKLTAEKPIKETFDPEQIKRIKTRFPEYFI